MNAEKLEALAESLIREPEISAVGLSSEPVPDSPAGGDIDLFVYGPRVPSPRARRGHYAVAEPDQGSLELRRFVSKRWGDADYCALGGVETWVMYFAEAPVLRDFESIVAGRQFLPDRGYYPTGRLAMFRNLRILGEKTGFLSGLKARLAVYPPGLKAAILGEALSEIDDDEDLERAVLRRDLLFYHAAAEAALDRLLQALYAANEVLFPGRKRVREIVASFALKPAAFYEELCEIVRLGARPESLEESFSLYRRLRDEVKRLCLPTPTAGG